MTTGEWVQQTRSERSVVGFLAFIGILMAFGIDAALPAFDELRVAFELDERGLSPAITGTVYFIGMALGQLVCGVLADRFGRRPVLLGGIAIYSIGALVAALAPNLGILLAARLVWGLGASAPTVLRSAIARDLFSGDQMARVVSTFSAVFLLGPIFVPFIGEGLLIVGSWRVVYAAALVLAVITGLWAARFGETLDPVYRRTLQLAPLRDAAVAVVRTKVTRWVLIGQAAFGGAFFVWLGSAQPILDNVYDRSSQFTLFFGASGIGMALALLFNRRLIDRYGVTTMVVRAATGFVAITVVGLTGTLLADGVPSVWWWFGWALVANAMSMIMGPMSVSMALEPMADKAGMASAILGVAQLGVGAGLAAIIDAQIDDTVTPMLVGSLVYGTVGLGCIVIATQAARSAPPAGDANLAASSAGKREA